jgi:hypothetical protein
MLWILVAVGILSGLGLALWPLLTQTSCIVEGTPIDTPAGLVLIENVRPGTLVWTCGPDGRREPGRVVVVHSARSRAWLEIELEDGTVFEVTARHPVRTRNDWTEAGALQVGDGVVTRDGVRALTAVRLREGDVGVFDLEVEPNPNFYAAGVRVHNKSRNDRNAAVSLKTLSVAQVDFKTNDRDGDGRQEFWVGDVSGLFTILGTDGQAIKLIDHAIAHADANPRPNGGGTKTIPLDPIQPKATYFYRALPYFEDEQGRGVPYDSGKGRHPTKYGFIAEPMKLPYAAPTLIINESGTVYLKDLQGLPLDRYPRNPQAEGWKSAKDYFR